MKCGRISCDNEAVEFYQVTRYCRNCIKDIKLNEQKENE